MSLILQNGISIIALLLLILVFVNGLTSQLQIALFGDVIITTVYFKFLLIISLIAAMLLRGSIGVPRWVSISIFVLLAYLGFDILRLTIYENFGVNYLIFGINSYYFFYLILPLSYGMKNMIPNRSIIRMLYFLAVPLIILGFFQWWLRNPLLPTASANEAFFVGSWQFDQRVRAFSLFNSPFEFGQFLIFIMALSLASFLFTKHSPWTLLVFSLSVIGILMTLTRNVYVGASCTLITILLMGFIKNWKYLIPLPLIYGALSFLLANSSRLFKAQSGISDAQNLNIRLDQWENYLNQLWRGGLDQLIFGSGYIQNDRFSQSQGTLIDNTYLAVVTHIGVVGLIIMLTILFCIWVSTLRKSHDSTNALTIACCAFISSYLAMGVFNIVLTIPGLIAVIFIISSKSVKSPIAVQKYTGE
ncbi:O-antigen ligase family protein [Deinococcus humi]|uniref:O-antigen ligase domain-containing protein n=1 Tax=Deinococcus humi TaxID=662880 RepID=A0A7W8JR54_9DEIO|nr:hypothetical protein [Deinococcus humi]MBB5361420.1 hypothetical protein [Deinococcus humi]